MDDASVRAIYTVNIFQFARMAGGWRYDENALSSEERFPFRLHWARVVKRGQEKDSIQTDCSIFARSW